MARIRTIKPDFFRHEKLYEAEREAGFPLRLAFAGLWTAADREGRFKWKPRQLKLDCLPYDDVDFSATLDALAEYGFVKRYIIDGEYYGFIPSWHEHQHVNQREAQSTIPAPTDDCIVNAEVCTETHVRAHGEGKGREGKGTDSPTRDDASPPTKRSHEVGKQAAELFERFWLEYPRRDGSNPKQPAAKKFLGLILKGPEIDTATAEAVIGGAKRYAEEIRRTGKTGTGFVAQAVTWLNQNRWQDYGERSAEPAAMDLGGKYYAPAGSDQLDAWDAYRQRTEGKTYPKDKAGGWIVPAEWPPDRLETVAA